MRIEEVFEKSAKRYPYKVAVEFENEKITYADLAAISDRLSDKILSVKKSGGSEFIGIYMDKSLEMLICILAVLKSGHAYVPLDPINPLERIEYCMREAEIDFVITNRECSFTAVDCFKMEDLLRETSSNEIKAQREKKQTKNAYIIFTSGTTGNPKGVVVEHSNVISLFENAGKVFDFSEKDVWTVFHSFAFDFSVWECFGGLFFGGKVILVPRAVAKNPPRFYKFLKDHSVTVLNQTTAAFIKLAQISASFDYRLDKLRYAFFGGEKLMIDDIRTWIETNGWETKLLNIYGVTEGTVFTTYKELSESDFQNKKMSPIGICLPGSEIILIDDENMISDAGEILISGYGVASKYINNEVLTNEKFVTLADSLSSEQIRYYRTGDFAFRENDTLFYLCRKDKQIKFNGYRIELDEIEQAISENPKVKRAIANVTESDTGKRIICFLQTQTSDSDETVIEEIRDAIAKRLPFYMLPDEYKIVSDIPLTNNFKIDFEQLINM